MAQIFATWTNEEFGRAPCHCQWKVRSWSSTGKTRKVVSPSSEIIIIPKLLSQISLVIEFLLSFTQVLVDEMDCWDDLEDWIDTKLAKIPCFLDIVDRAFPIIRGIHGGPVPVPAGIPTAVQALPVGGNAIDGGLSLAPVFPIQRPMPPGAPPQTPFPDLHQFASRQDADIARAALSVRAATHGHKIDLVRFGTTPLGIQFL